VEGVGCDGEVAAVGVLAVSDADGIGEAGDLDALTAVDVASGALAPLQGVHRSATSFVGRGDVGDGPQRVSCSCLMWWVRVRKALGVMVRWPWLGLLLSRMPMA